MNTRWQGWHGTILAGRQEVVWNGQDENGRLVASGIYLSRFQAGTFMQTERMTLVK